METVDRVRTRVVVVVVVVVAFSSGVRIFGRMYHNSFPTCAFFSFFFKWRLAHAH